MAQERITVDPNQMRGPALHSRHPLPCLEREDVFATLEYAAAAAQERELAVVVPAA
jgi:uncharacterized protein (DUF433 family)